LRLWIKARARLPLLLHQLAKTGQDKFAVLFNLFVGERAERIQEYSSGFFVGLGGFGKCDFEVLPCHLEEGLRGGSSHENRTASTKAKIIIVAVQALATFLMQGHWRFGLECARTSLLRIWCRTKNYSGVAPERCFKISTAILSASRCLSNADISNSIRAIVAINPSSRAGGATGGSLLGLAGSS